MAEPIACNLDHSEPGNRESNPGSAWGKTEGRVWDRDGYDRSRI